jgi:hypothetical protein
VSRGARAAALALLLLALSADPLWACPMCVGNGFSARSRRAYVGITLILSGMPFAVGAFVWLQVKRAARQDPQGLPEPPAP